MFSGLESGFLPALLRSVGDSLLRREKKKGGGVPVGIRMFDVPKM